MLLASLTCQMLPMMSSPAGCLSMSQGESHECFLLKPARKDVLRDQSCNDFSRKQVLQDSQVSLSSIGVSTMSPTWSIILPLQLDVIHSFLILSSQLHN